MSALGQKRTFDLFNNFVGDLVETQRHFEAKRLCGFDIYDHSELYRSLDGKLSCGRLTLRGPGESQNRGPYRVGCPTGPVRSRKPNESDSRRASRIANELDELSCHRSP